jgi:hypothetical protein
MSTKTTHLRPRIAYLHNVYVYLVATVMIFFWRLTGCLKPDTDLILMKPTRRHKEPTTKSKRAEIIDELLRRSAAEWADDNIVMAEMIFAEAIEIRDMTEVEFNKL